MKSKYTELYKELDPIIKEDRSIVNFKIFKQKHSDLASKITFCSFNRRRNKILEIEKISKKRNIRKIKEISSNLNLEEIVKKIYPKTKNIEEYVKLAKIFIENPNISYSKIAKNYKHKLSDASFYAFRRSFEKFNKHNKVEKDENKKKNYIPVNVIYSLIYQREVKGIPKNSIQFLEEFIDELNKRKIVNWNLVTTSSKLGEFVEVRAVTK